MSGQYTTTDVSDALQIVGGFDDLLGFQVRKPAQVDALMQVMYAARRLPEHAVEDIVDFLRSRLDEDSDDGEA